MRLFFRPPDPPNPKKIRQDPPRTRPESPKTTPGQPQDHPSTVLYCTVLYSTVPPYTPQSLAMLPVVAPARLHLIVRTRGGGCGWSSPRGSTSTLDANIPKPLKQDAGAEPSDEEAGRHSRREVPPDAERRRSSVLIIFPSASFFKRRCASS
mgnify:CR=1 FL=1